MRSAARFAAGWASAGCCWGWCWWGADSRPGLSSARNKRPTDRRCGTRSRAPPCSCRRRATMSPRIRTISPAASRAWRPWSTAPPPPPTSRPRAPRRCASVWRREQDVQKTCAMLEASCRAQIAHGQVADAVRMLEQYQGRNAEETADWRRQHAADIQAAARARRHPPRPCRRRSCRHPPRRRQNRPPPVRARPP